MKVLFVLDALGEGGTEKSTADLLVPLRERGIDSSLAILRSRGEEGVERAVRTAGFEVRVLPPGSLPTQVRALRRVVREVRPDVIHSALFASNLRARLVRVVDRTPLVNGLVNTSYDASRLVNPDLSRSKLGLVRLVDAVTGRAVDRFHAVSAPVREHAIDRLHLRPDRITVVERGRDSTALGQPSPDRRHEVRASLGLCQDSEVVLNLARQEHQKGLDVLLRAVALLSDRSSLVVLQAGREGSASRQLESLHAELGLADRVRYLGHRKDVGDLLAAADLLVAPTRYEGMPGVLLEAMAMGAPVVASAIDTVTAVLEDGAQGVVVPVDDPAAFASAIAELLDDQPRRRAMSERSRTTFAERFSIDRAADGMAALYRTVVLGDE